MKDRKFRLNNPKHPAHGKYFRVRKVDGDNVLVYWCTWTYIYTWLFDWDLTDQQKRKIFTF